MINVHLKLPEEMHLKVKTLQLDYEKKGIRKTIKECYQELISKGLSSEKSK